MSKTIERLIGFMADDTGLTQDDIRDDLREMGISDEQVDAFTKDLLKKIHALKEIRGATNGADAPMLKAINQCADQALQGDVGGERNEEEAK